MNQLGDAHALAARALELARNGGVRRFEARALHLLGGIATRNEPADVDAGEAHCRAALTLAEELGMRPLVVHCHLGLGRLYRRTDSREQAEDHLATATAMSREMGMTYWLEKAEAEDSRGPA